MMVNVTLNNVVMFLSILWQRNLLVKLLRLVNLLLLTLCRIIHQLDKSAIYYKSLMLYQSLQLRQQHKNFIVLVLWTIIIAVLAMLNY